MRDAYTGTVYIKNVVERFRHDAYLATLVLERLAEGRFVRRMEQQSLRAREIYCRSYSFGLSNPISLLKAPIQSYLAAGHLQIRHGTPL